MSTPVSSGRRLARRMRETNSALSEIKIRVVKLRLRSATAQLLRNIPDFPGALPSKRQDDNQRDHCANQKAHAVGERKHHGVLVQFSARSKKPHTADPKDEKWNGKPKTSGTVVKRRDILAADVKREDDDSSIRARGSERPQLLNIRDQISAAIPGL